MGKGFAPSVAGRRNAHQTGIQHVLHVALQDAILDQHRALRRVAFVVDIERAAPPRQGAVIDHGNAFGGHPFADPPGKGRTALAVEVALKAMTDGLVQQNTRPAGAEHHRHFSGRCRAGVEIDHRLMHGGTGVILQGFVAERTVVGTSTTPGGTLFAASLRIGDDDRQAKPHQRTDIGHQSPVAPGDEDDFIFP